MFVAGDQISLQTSSSGAYGLGHWRGTSATSPAPVTSHEVKNPTIYYDPNSDAPFTSVVNTTLWQEFTGPPVMG